MKTIVVTGGASGIGMAVAEQLHRDGYRVVIFDVSADAAARSAGSIGCEYRVGNVSNPDQMAELFGEVSALFDGLDGLVNSAGLTRTGPTASLPVSDWRKVIDVNLTGTFVCCQASFPHLRTGASIVNIASIASVRALPHRAAYTATKFGVVGLTRVLAVEWAHRSIRVNAIGPTWTSTALIEELVARGKVDLDELSAKMPMGRLAEPHEIARPVKFLLSDDAAFITGQTLFVDGGYTWAG